jgi:hypothetical protein
MEIFSSLIEAPAPVEPIKFPEMGNLQILPYIRGRLVFADLLARIFNQGHFEHLLLDFPAFMNDPEWLILPLKLFPLISIAAFRRRDGGLRVIPFAPNDAACLAAYLALEKSIPFRCLDDSDMLNYPPKSIFNPPIRTGDDYRIFQQGLVGYFKPLWEQIESFWDQASAEQKFFTKIRARNAIVQLSEAVRFRRNSLLVCEYQLWWAIQKVLKERDSSRNQFLFKWKNAPGVLMSVDPYFAWISGLLDDFPAINLNFWQGLKGEERSPFDKLRVLEDLLEKVIVGDLAEEKNINQEISVRNLITFQGYLKKLMVSHQRFLPEAGNQLFHAAEVCVGREFHKALAKGLLHYPDTLNREQINLIVNSVGNIIIGGSGLELPEYDQWPSFYTGQPFSVSAGIGGLSSEDSETEARKKVVDRIHRKMTQKEIENFSDDTHQWVRWGIKADYRLHTQACAQARSILEKQRRQYSPKRSWGAMEGGIHRKATLAALARGERGIYVNHQIHNRILRGKEDEFTPVVFLFADKQAIDKSYSYTIFDGNLAQRNINLENNDFPFSLNPKPDYVYSLYYTTRKSEYLIIPHIQRENLTSLSLLYTKSIMGIERYQAITNQERRFQCRITPDSDSEVNSFPKSERAVAWGVKYSHDRTIVVAERGWKASPRLAEFAKKKEVKIQTIPLSTYRPDIINRLKRFYFLSTPLKKHPQREQIVRRFVDN